MLLRLQIENLAIIDALALDLDKGFTVLTGETGAGKSIILGAMNLVLGERASSDDVRTGCDLAVVEALFDITGRTRVREILDRWNLQEPGGAGGELVIRREINARGRSRSLINGRLVPLGQVRDLGDLLVDLHGQHQHQSLLKTELHREILDAFGGRDVAGALAVYGARYARHGDLLRRIDALNRDERELEREKGLLTFQLREIGEAGLVPGEDGELEEEQRRLQHGDALLKNAAGAINLLFEGEGEEVTAADLLARCGKLLAESARLDPSLKALSDRLEEARVEVEDLAATLRTYAANLEHNPGRLETVEDRLHLIRQLKKKYGDTIEEILAERGRIEEALHALTHSREELERLEAERKAAEEELVSAAEALSDQRHAAGKKLSEGLRRGLRELEMPKVEFEAALHRDGDEASGGPAVVFPDGNRYRIHPSGVDRVEFLISPNPGEGLKPLPKIASGGELSRIMLALKVLLRSADQVPTLIFDEIDTGISGATGDRIGMKMADLGDTYQVICISHLPQIAVKARHHFAVTKVREKRRTLTRVERITGDRRLQEIARLLGGKADSPIARRHARELLQGK